VKRLLGIALALGLFTAPAHAQHSGLVDSVGAATALNALNVRASIAMAGQNGCGFSLAAGTLIGTIVPEVSYDGGTTYVAAMFEDPVSGVLEPSLVFTGSNTASYRTVQLEQGVTHCSARVSAFTSGTATGTVRGTLANTTVFTEPALGQTYVAVVKGIAAAAAKDYINLFNASGSGKVLRVTAVYAIPDTTAAVTGVNVMAIFSRVSSAGATCTAGAIAGYDSRATAVPAQVTVSTNCTTDPTIVIDLGGAAIATDETPPGGGFGRQALYECNNIRGAQCWHFREGEGVSLKSVATLAPAGTVTIWIEFVM
jgi:hypothetical protein